MERPLYTYFNAFILARFMLFVFILVILYMFFSPVFSVAETVREEMSCSDSYTFMCLIAHITLPIVFIIVIALGIKYLIGEQQ